MKKFSKITALFMLVALVVLSLTSCGTPKIAATTADKDTVPTSLYKFFMYDTIETYQSYAEQQNMTWKQFSKELLSEDQTVAQYLDSQIKSSVEAFVVSEKIYKELGLELTVDEKTKVQEIYDSYISSIGGRSQMGKAIRKYGMTEERYKEVVTMLAASDIYSEKVDEAVTGEKGLTPVTETSVKDILKDYVRIKHVLIQVKTTVTEDNKTVELSDKEIDEEIQKATDKLNEYLEEYKSGKKTFDELIDKYTEDTGSKDYKYGYIFTDDGSMVEEFEKAAMSMNVGDTKIVKTVLSETDDTVNTYGVHLMLKLDVFEDMKEAISQAKDIAINAKYKEWEEKYKVTFDEKAIEKLSCGNFNPIKASK